MFHVVHPTQEPLDLMAQLIEAVTPPKGIVLDPFLGSGTTALAAKQHHRPFIGIEAGPDHFKTAKKRIRNRGACSRSRRHRLS